MMKQPDQNRKTFSPFHRALAFTLACAITVTVGSVVYAGYEQANKTKELANAISAQATLQSADGTENTGNYPTLNSTVTNNGDGTATIILNISDVIPENSNATSNSSSQDSTASTEVSEDSSSVPESTVPDSSTSTSSESSSTSASSSSSSSSDSSVTSNTDDSSSTSASSDVSESGTTSTSSSTTPSASPSATPSATPSASPSASPSATPSASEELDDSALPSDEELGISLLADTTSTNTIRLYAISAGGDSTLTQEQLSQYPSYGDGDVISYSDFTRDVNSYFKAYDSATGQFVGGVYCVRAYGNDALNTSVSWTRSWKLGMYTISRGDFQSTLGRVDNGTNKVSLYFVPQINLNNYNDKTEANMDMSRQVRVDFIRQEMYLIDFNFNIATNANDQTPITDVFSDITFKVTSGSGYGYFDAPDGSVRSVKHGAAAASIMDIITQNNGHAIAYVEPSTKMEITITLNDPYMISTFIYNGQIYRNSVYDAGGSSNWSTFASSSAITKPQLMELQFAKDADHNGIPDYVDPMQGILFDGIP